MPYVGLGAMQNASVRLLIEQPRGAVSTPLGTLPYAGLGAVPCTRTPFDRSQRVEELGHGPWARRGPWPLTSDRCHDDREKGQEK